MAKNKKSRAKHFPKAEAAKESYPPLTLGEFRVPVFDGLSAVFGARLADYPPMGSIPDEFQRFSGKFQSIVSALFYRGGTLAEHGVKLRGGINHGAAMTAIRAWLSSFEPKHEHKTATVAWALSEWTEPTDALVDEVQSKASGK